MSTQAEHDAQHPGQVCRDCPREAEHRARIAGLAERVRLPWWRRCFR